MQQCPNCGSADIDDDGKCQHCDWIPSNQRTPANEDGRQSTQSGRQRRQQPRQPRQQQGRQPQRQQPQNQQQPQGQQPPQGGDPPRQQHGGGPPRQPQGGDDGFTRREMLVGGVGIAGLAGAGWVVLGDGTLPLVGGDDKRGGPEGAIRAYVDALNAADAAALRDVLHEQSPLDEPEDGGLSDVQEMEFTLENATAVDEEISEDASEYDSVQAFEIVEFTLAVEGTEQAGGNEEFTQAFVVAQNQNGEWKLWNEPSTVTTQSEETGTESTEQVADSLDIVTEVGVVGPDNTITELRIGVGRAPGSGETNLAELTLQYVSDDAFANVIVGDDRTTGERARGDTNPEDIVVGDRDPDDERYAVDVITAASTDDVLVTEDADRYELVIPLGPGPGIELLSDGDTNGVLAPLSEGNEAEITITTEVGSQTVAFVQVPDSLAGMEPGEKVEL